MERILKEQFVNLTLILCEFERDFASEPGDLTEIHNDLKFYVNWSRDIMANCCFDNYQYVYQVFKEIISMDLDISSDMHKWMNTEYITYINSMRDIIAETANEILKIYDIK